MLKVELALQIKEAIRIRKIPENTPPEQSRRYYQFIVLLSGIGDTAIPVITTKTFENSKASISGGHPCRKSHRCLTGYYRAFLSPFRVHLPFH